MVIRVKFVQTELMVEFFIFFYIRLLSTSRGLPVDIESMISKRKVVLCSESLVRAIGKVLLMKFS